LTDCGEKMATNEGEGHKSKPAERERVSRVKKRKKNSDKAESNPCQRKKKVTKSGNGGKENTRGKDKK